MDPHLLFSQLGAKLGLLPEMTVRQAFVTLWAQNNPDQINEILAGIRKITSNSDII